MDVTGSTAGLAARASDGVGIIVVDRARKIVFKNALAESFLASNGSLLEYRQTLTQPHAVGRCAPPCRRA